MLRQSLAWCGAFLALSGLTTPVLAAPGDSTETSGDAAAEVVEIIAIRHVADMRFGLFASPGTASTLTVAPDGSFSATGDVVSSTNMPQPTGGRGPAEFIVEQAGNQGGTVFVPGTITVSNGAQTMVVNSITGRLVVISGTGRDRVYRLDLGGTLRVNANQAPGSYVGDFDATVVYN